MTTIADQLTKYLTDAHSIEKQAIAQLKLAPRMAGDPVVARAFSDHLRETEQHESRVRAALDARGASPSALKEVVMQAGGLGFALFARLQPDTPGKLVAHSYSYEHLELGGYELLERIARRAGDEDVARMAAEIGDQERVMGERLADDFDRAAEASLRAKGAERVAADVVKYLEDAHAIEAQSVRLLERAPGLAGASELEAAYADHLNETREQQRLVEQRLRALGASPSALKDAAMRLGGLNWSAFFQAHPDTPGKLAAFAFALEHLEIGGYELLVRVARRAGDEETVALAENVLGQERAAAERIAGLWDVAAEASLRAAEVPVA
jgi:ferritin-like metal-binding protein YciE